MLPLIIVRVINAGALHLRGALHVVYVYVCTYILHSFIHSSTLALSPLQKVAQNTIVNMRNQLYTRPVLTSMVKSLLIILLPSSPWSALCFSSCFLHVHSLYQPVLSHVLYFPISLLLLNDFNHGFLPKCLSHLHISYSAHPCTSYCLCVFYVTRFNMANSHKLLCKFMALPADVQALWCFKGVPVQAKMSGT